MTSTKESAINTASSLISQIVTIAIGFILPRLYLETFGSEVNGLVSSITQFITYFTIVEAGLSSTAVNALYEPLALRDRRKINCVLTTAKSYYNHVGLIFTVLVIALSLIYPLFINEISMSFFEISLLVCVLGVGGALDFFTLSKYRALLTADRKYYVIANATTIASVLNLIFVMVSVRLVSNVIFIRVVALSFYIIRSLVLNVYVRLNYKELDFNSVVDNSLLSKRKDAMLLQLLGLAQTSTPVVILTFFCDDLKIVSVWSIYNMVYANIIALLNSFSNGFVASLGKSYAEGDLKGLNFLFNKFQTVFYITVSWVFSCVACLYIPFVKVYTSNVSDMNYVSHTVALLFAANGLFYSLKTTVGTLIGAAGVYKETKPATIIQTVIAVGVSLMLVGRLGINGVLIGLILSNIYRDVELILFMYKNILKKSCLYCFGQCMVTVLCVLISSVFFYNLFDPDSFGGFLLGAVVVALLCALVTVVIWAIFYGRNIMNTFVVNKNRRDC